MDRQIYEQESWSQADITLLKTEFGLINHQTAVRFACDCAERVCKRVSADRRALCGNPRRTRLGGGNFNRLRSTRGRFCRTRGSAGSKGTRYTVCHPQRGSRRSDGACCCACGCRGRLCRKSRGRRSKRARMAVCTLSLHAPEHTGRSAETVKPSKQCEFLCALANPRNRQRYFASFGNAGKRI